MNHYHLPADYPRDGEPVSVYAHGNAFSVAEWAAHHWEPAYKAKIRQCPANPDDPLSVLFTVDVYFWFPYDQEFFKFWQLKNDKLGVANNHKLIAKCPDPSMPTGRLQLVFSVSANPVNFKSTDFMFSKRLSAEWKFLDGNPTKELNVPLDDDSVVGNGWGIFPRDVYDKLDKEGYFRSRAPSVPSVAAVSICV